MKQSPPGNTGSRSLGLVTCGSVGWKTVRSRWEADLAETSASVQHIESHFRTLTDATERFGAKSIGHALSGRGAANAAIAQGAKVILMSTLQNAPLVPLRKDVTYLIYGDCTTHQLAALYGGKRVGFPGALINKRIQALADHGVIFLCMSDWYRRALRAEFDIPEEQLVPLPFYVDTDRWRPRDAAREGERARVLFLGADLARKGGDIVYQLAARPEFAHVDFHVVSPNAGPGPANLVVHAGLRPESDALVALVRSCDLLLLPTRADTSSLAALEAAACGVPAIITGLGGIPEIVLDGVSGKVLAAAEIEPFAAALSAYLSNPALIAAHGRAARLRVERLFSRFHHFETLRRALAKAAAKWPADTAPAAVGAAVISV
jgi:glycosyltransferase involved in cell wall biosynthesis